MNHEVTQWFDGYPIHIGEYDVRYSVTRTKEVIIRTHFDGHIFKAVTIDGRSMRYAPSVGDRWRGRPAKD